MAKSNVLGVLLVGFIVITATFIPVAVAQSDDWPDERDAATEVSPGTYSGTVSSEDDRDYLKVAVQRGDTVTFTLDKEIRKDTWMSVVWPGGSVFVDGQSDETLTRKVTAEENGYVYVNVGSDTASDGSESWELTVQRNAGADGWGDSRDAANEISSGTHTGTVNSPDDRDYAKIPVQVGDTVTFTLDKEIRKDTWMSVVWPGGSVFVDGENDETLTRKVTAEENGYVYVNTGSDTVTTGTEPWSLQVEKNAGADGWGDSRDAANEISSGTHTGTVNSPDDRDYARVPVRVGDTVTFRLQKSAGKDTWMTVVWPGGSVFVDGENDDVLTRKVTAEENGYVYVNTGSDTVTTDTEPWELDVARNQGADEWADNRDTAKEVSVGSTVTGDVNSPDDRDYVMVPVREGDTVAVELEKPIGKDTWMTVVWPGGSVFVDGENDGTLTRTVTAEENGYVYVNTGSDTVTTGTEPWSMSIGQDSGEAGSTSTTTETTTWQTTTTTTETPRQSSDAAVTFDDQSARQTASGTTVSVESVTLPDGGFVGVAGDFGGGGTFVGMKYLSPGTHSAVEVSLDRELPEQMELYAYAIRDENDNREFDPNTEEFYVDGDNPVGDLAVVSPDERLTTTTATETPTTTAGQTTTEAWTTTEATTTTWQTTDDMATESIDDDTETDQSTESALTTAPDSDGDGVSDSEDYAPDDPDVQEKSDLQSTGSSPGFGLGGAIVALLLASFVALRRQ